MCCASITAEDLGHDRDKTSGEFKTPFWFEINYFKANGSSNNVEQQTTSLTNSSLGMVELFDSNFTTTTTTTPTTTTTGTTTTTTGTTTTTAIPFVEEEPVFPESFCGVGPAKTLTMEEQRIVGGTEAVKNSWPGIVSFFFNVFKHTNNLSKIAKKYVYFNYFCWLFR